MNAANSRNNASKPKFPNTAKVAPQPVASTSDQSSAIEKILPQKPPIRFLDTQENHESITIIWLDLQPQVPTNFYSALRIINHCVESYTDPELCFTSMESFDDRVFFICTSTNLDLITRANATECIEAIFILKADEPLAKTEFPKLIGMFEEQEELLRALRETIEVIQYIKFEEFLFEEDKEFLWTQLWRDQILPRKPVFGKQEFIEVVQNYYQHNSNVIALIEVFDHSYILADALSWCLRSPFPSRFLSHALYSRDMDQLSSCRFLIGDASRFIKRQNKHNSSAQFYRGMKLPPALIDKLTKNTGGLMCTSWFLICTKSRTAALAAALSPAYRPDLIPVLFKIDCDSTTPYFELTKNMPTPTVVLDVCTTFRLLYVGQDQMVVVKMKVVSDDGQKMAREYKKKFENLSTEVLLAQLVDPRKSLKRHQKDGQSSSAPGSNTHKKKAKRKKRSGHSGFDLGEGMNSHMTEAQRNQMTSSDREMESVRSIRSKLERRHGMKWRDLARR